MSSKNHSTVPKDHYCTKKDCSRPTKKCKPGRPKKKQSNPYLQALLADLTSIEKVASTSKQSLVVDITGGGEIEK